ncbi:SigE family RNA polymerase sigma factor [Actinocorallia longicatena]|uniref:SigE family RNA polymerase sigma factor n=1 Tax=Actinocorallia longicatena TaxID=111803 RepID=A0ABP6QE62_9ACTN
MADRSDYQAFVASRWPRLLRLAYLLTQDWQSAEDLVQTALVKAWFAWPRVTGDPEPYLRKIIVNTHSSWWRRAWRSREITSEAVPDRPGPDHTAHTGERDLVWDALGRLPDRQRTAVVLRFYEDLPEAQVAELMHCSVGTVKSQTSRALAKLRVDPAVLTAQKG